MRSAEDYRLLYAASRSRRQKRRAGRHHSSPARAVADIYPAYGRRSLRCTNAYASNSEHALFPPRRLSPGRPLTHESRNKLASGGAFVKGISRGVFHQVVLVYQSTICLTQFAGCETMRGGGEAKLLERARSAAAAQVLHTQRPDLGGGHGVTRSGR